MNLPDVASSRAVLIGVNQYPGITDLPAVANNLTKLAGLFTDPDLWGLQPSHCTVLSNPDSCDQVLDSVHRAASEASDTLIVYFAGHGLLDEQTSELQLAMPRTTEFVRHNAIRYDDIRKIINRTSEASSKVVMLDCCFSGAALEGFMGAQAGIADRSRIDGTYLITASAETAAASAPVGATYTAFTGEIINALERGVPGGPDLLDVDTLYWHIRQELETKGLPVPQQRARNSGGTIVLTRNRRNRREADRTSPAPERAPVPKGAGELLHHEPRDFFAAIDTFGAVNAKAVLEAAGAHRPDQEVAGLVLFAERRGTPDVVSSILDGASHRPAEEVAAIATVLHDVELGSAVHELLRLSSTHSVRRVGQMATALHTLGWPEALRDFLDYAAERWAMPDSIVGLVGALSQPSLRAAADAMLISKALQTPPADALVIGDALLGGGRDEAAFGFYRRALGLIVARAAADIASLVAAMFAANHHAAAEELGAAAFAQARTPEASAELAVALWEEGLRDMVDLGLDTIATAWPPEELVVLGRLIRRAGHADAEIRLFATASAEGGARTTEQLMRALQDAGLPRSARQLLDEATNRLDTGEVVRLIATVAGTGQHIAVQRMTENLLRDGGQRLTDVSPADSELLARCYAASVGFDATRIGDVVSHLDAPNHVTPSLMRIMAERADDSALVGLAAALRPHSWCEHLLTYIVAGTPDRADALTAIVPSLRARLGSEWLRTMIATAQRQSPVPLTTVLENVQKAGFAADVSSLFSTNDLAGQQRLATMTAALDVESARQIFDDRLSGESIQTLVRVAAELVQHDCDRHVEALIDSFVHRRNDAAAANVLARGLENKGLDRAARYLRKRVLTEIQQSETPSTWWTRRRG